MKRRDFIASSAAALGATAVASQSASAQEAVKPTPFKLKYAPHFGMLQNLAGGDMVDQLKFAADQGFTAWEDNGMKGRSKDTQDKIAKTMESLGMTMGVFVAHASFGDHAFVTKNKDARQKVVQEVRDSVEVAKRVNAKWMTVVPDSCVNNLEWGYQTANCIDLLRELAEVLEPHGLVMVLEPLNWWANHPGLFLTKIPQAYEICRAVNSPSCKILFDIYHQQIQEGNLIPNIDMAWSEIGYFQCGDNPGRKEPGTGEINYRNVFKHIHSKGFEGIMGMEHGNSQRGKEGDQAVIDAYRAADDF
ncbi:hydroxypyruvate isomerase family protein [Aeoliella mucimassa]|uniref:Hydroxypyruvate isomerase n=1 Tax=Aeoliella mucimassa TaxID=2527972 RepID=A0A518ATK4_9BACT|nr:TIM barrel protein [Aeoliella mucimassa]QDU58036.1 Hydroxypyruvate isomerase [Aeoliella mucimassa]